MIHIIIGTKAQLVKMTPIMVELRHRCIEYNFIFTGQHRATINEMLAEFDLKRPDIKLYSGPDIVSLAQMSFWLLHILKACLTSKEEIFKGDHSGIVLVHGDTFSTLVGAMMGKIAGLKVGHVESGLRSYNLFHPFPEEITRLLTFKLSDLLFCPGSWAVNNLRAYKKRKKIINTKQNTMLDTVKLSLDYPRNKDHIPSGKYAIVSLHRYENIFSKKVFRQILSDLEKISEKINLLFILHPPTEKQLRRFALYDQVSSIPGIELRPRYSYLDFVSLLEHTEFIVTDGGSIQEESSYLGIPCLLFRKATEREEGLGVNVVLSEFDEQRTNDFVANYKDWRQDTTRFETSPSQIIIESIKEYV